jgi:hypothetical protein
MLSSAVRITEDLPGLEKTLRLFQGLSTIAVGLAQTPQEVQLRSRAVSQFAVSASITTIVLTMMRQRPNLRLLTSTQAADSSAA